MRSAADIEDVGWPEAAAVLQRMLSTRICWASSCHCCTLEAAGAETLIGEPPWWLSDEARPLKAGHGSEGHRSIGAGQIWGSFVGSAFLALGWVLKGRKLGGLWDGCDVDLGWMI